MDMVLFETIKNGAIFSMESGGFLYKKTGAFSAVSIQESKIFSKGHKFNMLGCWYVSEPLKCVDCKYALLRRIQTGSDRRYDYDFQKVCRRGVKNPLRGHAKRLTWKTNTGETMLIDACEHYAEY